MTTITEAVTKRVQAFELGRIFDYWDLPSYADSPSSVAKVIGKMVADGEIARLEKGKFYRPKKSILGLAPLKPSNDEILKMLLIKEGKQIGYVTGAALYNSLGLTTQVPATLTVAIFGQRQPQKKKYGGLSVKVTRARAAMTNPLGITLLQYLDVLRGIKAIPNAVVDESLMRMSKKIAALNDLSLTRLQSLAIKYYNPRTCALLGLLLETNGQPIDKKLRKTINPTTTFSLGLNENKWPVQKSWNIK